MQERRRPPCCPREGRGGTTARPGGERLAGAAMASGSAGGRSPATSSPVPQGPRIAPVTRRSGHVRPIRHRHSAERRTPHRPTCPIWGPVRPRPGVAGSGALARRRRLGACGPDGAAAIASHTTRSSSAAARAGGCGRAAAARGAPSSRAGGTAPSRQRWSTRASVRGSRRAARGYTEGPRVALPTAAGSRSAAVGPAAGAPPAGRPRHRMSGCAAVPPLVTTDRARGEGPSRPRGRVRDAGRGLPACPGNRAVALRVVQ